MVRCSFQGIHLLNTVNDVLTLLCQRCPGTAPTAEGLRSFEGQEASAKKRERGPVVLTQRDRELLVHLALARHLSADQIGRLVFAGKTDSVVRRRLCRLASGKHPYVGRVPFRTRDGVRTVVWSLRSLGYLAARNLFGE